MGVQDVLGMAGNETQESVHMNRFHFSWNLVWIKYLMLDNVCCNENQTNYLYDKDQIGWSTKFVLLCKISYFKMVQIVLD